METFSLPSKCVWESALQSGMLKVHISHLIKIPPERTSYSRVLLYLCSLPTDSAFRATLLTSHHQLWHSWLFTASLVPIIFCKLYPFLADGPRCISVVSFQQMNMGACKKHSLATTGSNKGSRLFYWKSLPNLYSIFLYGFSFSFAPSVWHKGGCCLR